MVYNGEPERYFTFIPPECYHAIEKYLEFRQEHGEELGATSPLFRDKFDPVNGHSNDNIGPMTAPAIRQYYNRLLHSMVLGRKLKEDMSLVCICSGSGIRRVVNFEACDL